MPLLGKGAVAMWWTVDPGQRAEFGDWHSHEHLPERMGIPGFLRGSRWAARHGDGGFFVLYELSAYDTLTSGGYLDRLNNPTPWSTAMMPHHLGMVRSQCRVVASHGGGLAGALVTVRFSPAGQVSEPMLGDLVAGIADRPGLTGAHVLRTETPASRDMTTEQRIRGGDDAADWIMIVSGYDPAALTAAVSDRLRASTLETGIMRQAPQVDEFRLAYAFTPDDVAGDRGFGKG